jgi:hypothetical protein
MTALTLHQPIGNVGIISALAGCARRPSPAWLESIRGYVHEYRRNPDIVLRIERDGRTGACVLKADTSDAQIGA